MYIENMAKKRIKRPRDPVQLAKLIGDIATGQVQDAVEDGKDAAAVSLGQKGGEARAKKLTVEQRAEIAKLADHKIWHSHGRFIGSFMLNNELRLEIDDYPDQEARTLIRAYNDLLTDFIEQKGYIYYMHDKRKTAEGGAP